MEFNLIVLSLSFLIVNFLIYSYFRIRKFSGKRRAYYVYHISNDKTKYKFIVDVLKGIDLKKLATKENTTIFESKIKFNDFGYFIKLDLFKDQIRLEYFPRFKRDILSYNDFKSDIITPILKKL